MSIIVHDADVKALVRFSDNRLNICFADPAYIRSESVVIDVDTRAMAVVFEQGFHNIGQLPENINIKILQEAYLSGESHDLSLRAPVKFTSH